MDLGNESYPEVNVTKPQIEFPGEETTIKHAVPSSDQLEDKKELLNDQVFQLFFIGVRLIVYLKSKQPECTYY